MGNAPLVGRVGRSARKNSGRPCESDQPMRKTDSSSISPEPELDEVRVFVSYGMVEQEGGQAACCCRILLETCMEMMEYAGCRHSGRRLVCRDCGRNATGTKQSNIFIVATSGDSCANVSYQAPYAAVGKSIQLVRAAVSYYILLQYVLSFS